MDQEAGFMNMGTYIRRSTTLWLGLLPIVMLLLSALPVAAASTAGLYVATADSRGGGFNQVNRIKFGSYSTTRIYQGSDVNKPYALALDTTAGKAFTVLSDAGGQRVSAIDLISGTATAITASETSGAGLSLSGIALDRVSGSIYFSTASSLVATDNRVRRMAYDGSGVTTVYDSGGSTRKPVELAVDHGNNRMFIVFSNGADSWIASAGLDGSGLAEIPGTRMTGSGVSVGGMVLDTTNSFLYYTVSGSLAAENNRIYRISYDGSTFSTLYSGNIFDKPTYLALDQNNTIYAAFTGSDYQMVKSSSLANPAAMVWTTVPNTLFSTIGVSISGLATPSAQLSAVTDPASSVTGSTATLNGTVNACGISTSVGFDYGPDTGYGATVPATPSPLSSSADTAVSAPLSGLSCATRYHYRVTATNSSGTVTGGDRSFTTGACPTYSVTYQGNGNTGGSVPGDSTAYLSGAPVTVADNSGFLAKNGFSFAGWNSLADGSGTGYPAGSSFIITTDTVLHTVWVAYTCSAKPSGVISWFQGKGNAVDRIGGNNGTLHSRARVAENATAIATCVGGATIVSYSSLYGAASKSVSCGSCTIGATGCNITYNNANCGDPIAGTAKTGTLDLTCATADSSGFATGKVGRAFSFNGSGDYVTQGSSYKGRASSSTGSAFTMEFWARPTATIGTFPASQSVSGYASISGQRYALFPEYQNSASEAGAGVSVGTNGIVVVEHSYDNASAPLVYTMNNDIPDDGWLHIAVVYENQTPKLYVNGVLKKSGLSSGKTVYPSSAFGENGSGYGYYSGSLDEVHIVNRALSAAEILALYRSSSAGVCVPPVPVVSGIAPASGSTDGRTAVVITGTGLSGATAVRFGSNPAAGFTVDSDTRIRAVSPTGDAGTVDITVTTEGGSSIAGSTHQFTYTYAPTSKLFLKPLGADDSAGPGYATIGSILKAANGKFYDIGYISPNVGVADTFIARIETKGGETFTFKDITFGTPFDNLFFGMLEITLFDGQGVQLGGPISFQMSGESTDFTYISGASLSALYGQSPWTVENVAAVEIAFNLYGSDYIDEYLNVWPATPQSIYFESITIADLKTPPPAPVLTAISPSSGSAAGGTSVIISGNSFSGASAVAFGVSAATGFVVNSDTQITAVSPAAVAGTIADITVTTPGGTSAVTNAGQFTFTQDQAKNMTSGISYANLATALSSALAGAEIRAYESRFDGIFILEKGLHLKGGYDSAFLTLGSEPTTLNGGLTVKSGTSSVEKVLVKGKLLLTGGTLRVKDVSVR
jgi:hypothetical protein